MDELLRQLSLEKYIPVFETNNITLSIFLNLTEKHLTDMGITLFGPRKKLLNVIQQYQEKGIIAAPEDVVVTHSNLEIAPRSREGSLNHMHMQRLINEVILTLLLKFLYLLDVSRKTILQQTD